MKTILLTLLVISLAFNVSFVLSSMLADKQPDRTRTFEGRLRRMAEKLQLDQQQDASFEQFLARFSDLRQANAPRREEFFDELLKPAADQKLLEDFCVGPDALEYRLAILTLIREFVVMLRPEQLDICREMIRNRHSSGSDTQRPSSE